MTNKLEHSSSSSRCFAFYHQNEALLFQFLLHECLCAHGILRKRPDPGLLPQVVGNLQGPSTNWHAPSGHLPRLFHYTGLFTSHFNTPPTRLCTDLGLILERAHQAAMHHSDLKCKDDQADANLYTLLRREIRAFLTLLFERLPQYRDNPSVLYFLLRNQEQFDTVCRQPIIKKTFVTFFPDGMKQAHHFLTENFVRKGFNHLIPSLELKLKKLEKS